MPVHACVAHHTYRSNVKNGTKEKPAEQIIIKGMNFKTIPYNVVKNRANIEELIMDHNLLTENSFNMPKFTKLRNLSVRNNKIRNLSVLLTNLQSNCPNLENLNIENNPGWSNSLKELEMQMISRFLKKLRTLNGSETPRQKRLSACSTSSTTSSGSD